MGWLRATVVSVLALSAGCSDDGGGSGTSGNGTTPTRPATDGADGSTSTGDPGDGSGTTGSRACKASADCGDGDACAAPHDAGGTEPAGDFTCHHGCVDNGVVSLWCKDDAACCLAGARCEVGLCVGGAESTSTATGTSTGTGTGTTTTGGATTSSTGTGTTG